MFLPEYVESSGVIHGLGSKNLPDVRDQGHEVIHVEGKVAGLTQTPALHPSHLGNLILSVVLCLWNMLVFLMVQNGENCSKLLETKVIGKNCFVRKRFM